MYEFQTFLVAEDGYRSVQGRRDQFTVVIDGPVLFELNRPVPLIIPNRKCEALAVPFEMHISANHTTVFFTKVRMDYSQKLLDGWYKLYQISTGRASGAGTANRQDSDTRRTGMDAATRMMMGDARSPREIARGESSYGYGDDDDDDDRPSIYDMMRASNPGDDFFR